MDYWWNWQRLFRDLKKDSKEFFTNLWENIVEIFSDTFIYLPKKIKFFIVRMIELVPIAWNDADWDWDSILTYLEFKIKKTRDHVNEHRLHTRWKQDVRDMDKALDLITRCRDNYYHLDKLEKVLEEKYGKSIRWTSERLDNDAKYVGSRSKFQREKWTPELDKEICRAERNKFRKVHKLYQKDWDNLGKLLSSKMRNWWC